MYPGAMVACQEAIAGTLHLVIMLETICGGMGDFGMGLPILFAISGTK